MGSWLADGAAMGRPKVGEILVGAGLIDEAQLRAALGDQNNWGQRLGITLVKMGFVEERDLVRALAQQLQLPVVGLEGKRVPPEVLELVPVEFAEKHLCVPLFIKEGPGGRTLFVGMDDPGNLAAIDDLGFKTGLVIQPVLVAPSELCEAIDRFYRCVEERAVALDTPDSGLDLEGAAFQRTGVEHTPNVEESLFPDLDEIASAAPAEVPAQAPAEAPITPDPEEGTNRTILRALCQLLVEKQVIDRRELHELVEALQNGPRRG